MIQETSLEAYECIMPHLNRMHRLFYNLIKLYPDLSNRELGRLVSKPINTVTPRVNELREKGLVICTGYKVDPITHKRVMVWGVP